MRGRGSSGEWGSAPSHVCPGLIPTGVGIVFCWGRPGLVSRHPWADIVQYIRIRKSFLLSIRDNCIPSSVVLVNHNYYQTPTVYSEPLKDLVNCTVTEIMESCTQCHYN